MCDVSVIFLDITVKCLCRFLIFCIDIYVFFNKVSANQTHQLNAQMVPLDKNISLCVAVR